VSGNMTKHEALCWALIRNIHPNSLDKDLVSTDDAEAVIASAATLLLVQRGQDSPAEFSKLKDELRGIFPYEYGKWKKART
jgi:5,10-methenyltetrahydromethanopterin hydrogenase